MIMRKLLLFLVLAAAMLTARAQSDTLSADTLHYRMNYHWGFINKTAGEGTVVTRASGDTVSVSFSARSIPWGGRLYSVKDSLVATLKSTPSLSEDVIYENGTYTKPMVSVGTDGVLNIQRNYPYKNIMGKGTLSASDATMQAITITADMLSLFKWGSVLDFDSMQPGQLRDVVITGADPGKLQVRYNGKTNLQLDGVTLPVYSIVFTFEYEGAMSDYPVTAYIGTPRMIPVFFSADLKIGHVQMALENVGELLSECHNEARASTDSRRPL